MSAGDAEVRRGRPKPSFFTFFSFPPVGNGASAPVDEAASERDQLFPTDRVAERAPGR